MTTGAGVKACRVSRHRVQPATVSRSQGGPGSVNPAGACGGHGAVPGIVRAGLAERVVGQDEQARPAGLVAEQGRHGSLPPGRGLLAAAAALGIHRVSRLPGTGWPLRSRRVLPVLSRGARLCGAVGRRGCGPGGLPGGLPGVLDALLAGQLAGPLVDRDVRAGQLQQHRQQLGVGLRGKPGLPGRAQQVLAAGVAERGRLALGRQAGPAQRVPAAVRVAEEHVAGVALVAADLPRALVPPATRRRPAAVGVQGVAVIPQPARS